MLEIAILVCVAAIFVILAVRFPRTKKNFAAPDRELDEKSLIAAKKILEEKEEIPEVPAVSDPEDPVDELDRYDEELAELLKSAREKIEAGKYVSAEGILIDAICKDSRCAWAYEQLGSIYLSMGKNFSDAAESFLMATKLDPERDLAWFGLGQIYLQSSQTNKAIDAFSRAVNISRANPEYQAALGKAYLEVRQYGRAAKSLKRAAQLDISNQEYKKLASLAEDKHREHSQASKLN